MDDDTADEVFYSLFISTVTGTAIAYFFTWPVLILVTVITIGWRTRLCYLRAEYGEEFRKLVARIISPYIAVFLAAIWVTFAFIVHDQIIAATHLKELLPYIIRS